MATAWLSCGTCSATTRPGCTNWPNPEQFCPSRKTLAARTPAAEAFKNGGIAANEKATIEHGKAVSRKQWASGLGTQLRRDDLQPGRRSICRGRFDRGQSRSPD